MRKFSRLLILTSVLFCGNTVAGKFSDAAGDWLADQGINQSGFDIKLVKSKLSFEGCKQRKYQLLISQQISSRLNIQAVVHYDKGVLEYGILNQKVTSRAYELISWWQHESFRVGLSHKTLAEHDLASLDAEVFTLPTSRSLGLYVQMQGVSESHSVTFSAVRETWHADSASLYLPWDTSRDNQVALNYKISF